MERTGQNTIKIRAQGRVNTGYWDQMDFIDVPAFNAAVAAGNFDPVRFEELKSRSTDSRFIEQSNVTVWSDDPQPKYAATLQAGGMVNLNVARTVQNGSLRANNTPEILTGTLGEDQTALKVGGLDITINKQATDASAASVASVQPAQRVAADRQRADRVHPGGLQRHSVRRRRPDRRRDLPAAEGRLRAVHPQP